MYERLWCENENQHSEYGVIFFTPLSNALARMYANPALQVSCRHPGAISSFQVASATVETILLLQTYALV